MNQRIERRMVPAELRVQQRADGGAVLVGHAAVFNAPSEDLGGFREIVAPGAFSQTIVEDDIRALFNHDANQILGRNRASTLRLAEDSQGLAYEIDLPDTQLARDLAASVERGDISGNSFSFQTLEDRWERLQAGEMRTLISVRLFDVGPVVFPAYPQTDVALRSLEAWRSEEQRRASPPALDPRDARLDILAPGLRRSA